MEKVLNSHKIKARFLGSGTLVLGDVTIEENCWIGYNCLLDGLNAPLVIKKNSTIASYVAIYTHNTMWRDIGIGEKIIAEVIIGENVHIGHGAVVVPKKNGRIYIGNNVLVEAKAVVSDSVPAWHIYKRDGRCIPIKI